MTLATASPHFGERVSTFSCRKDRCLVLSGNVYGRLSMRRRCVWKLIARGQSTARPAPSSKLLLHCPAWGFWNFLPCRVLSFVSIGRWRDSEVQRGLLVQSVCWLPPGTSLHGLLPPPPPEVALQPALSTAPAGARLTCLPRE